MTRRTGCDLDAAIQHLITVADGPALVLTLTPDGRVRMDADAALNPAAAVTMLEQVLTALLGPVRRPA